MTLSRRSQTPIGSCSLFLCVSAPPRENFAIPFTAGAHKFWSLVTSAPTIGLEFSRDDRIQSLDLEEGTEASQKTSVNVVFNFTTELNENAP